MYNTVMVTYILCQYTLDAPHETDGEESTWTNSNSKQMKGVDESMYRKTGNFGVVKPWRILIQRILTK